MDMHNQEKAVGKFDKFGEMSITYLYDWIYNYSANILKLNLAFTKF